MKNLKQRLIVLARKAIYHSINILNIIFPKSRNKIFFYDSTFRKDNLWVLLNYMIENKLDEKYQIVYFVKKHNDNLNTYKKNITFVNNNIIGLFHQLTSKFVFWAFGTYRFTCKPKRGQVIVNLWHGSPLKSIGYLAGRDPWYRYESAFSYILCASDFFKEVMKICYECDDSQAIIFGSPRMDLIHSKKDCFKNLDIDKEKYSKIILWMPTYRKSAQNPFVDSSVDFPIIDVENIKKFNIELGEKKVLLIIKPHPAQADLEIFKSRYSNIVTFSNNDLELKDVELYELLGQIDVLLTDYSSVYFDFLVTNKPIGFVINDINEYNEKRGFVVDEPLDLMPGEKIYTYDQLINFIEDINNDKDKFNQERKNINNLVNKYKDDNNCKRLLEYLGIN